MILMRILPGVLKELSRHVPAVLFQTVEWSELAQELPKISRRMIQKEGFNELFQHQEALLAPFKIVLTQTSLRHQSLLGQKWAGEQILTLYFAQLFSPEGVFLDLRSHHFQANEEVLKWHPSGLWTKFDENFRTGLLHLYEGFYLENNELYYDGLTKVGLLQPDWSESDKKELGNLFKEQFGGAISSEMNFDLDHFKNSIIRLSNFMINKRVKIPKDFIYLGIYLVGMYASLEETRQTLPVKTIYLQVRDYFNAKEHR